MRGGTIQKTTKEGVATPTLLIILDGFGIGTPDDPGNAITPKTAPRIFGYMKRYPSTTLAAHGTAVGLFRNQEGNSEAGHFNIGAGRVVEQDLVRISRAIKNGTFFKNEAFKQAIHHAKKHHAAVHVMGLLTDGQSAHAHPDHLYALLQYIRDNFSGQVYLHLFTDGRDAPPHAAVGFLRALRARLQTEEIATVMGRFYAMDRNKLWKRTQAAYETMVCGKGTCTADSAEEAIAQAYNRGETDEYVCPTVIKSKGKPIAKVEDNDAIFFFNARSDRARQLTKAFVQKDFIGKNPGAFRRSKMPKNTRFVAMTDFGPDLQGVFTAFPSPDVSYSLAAAVGAARRQLYISETEKYAHVTYFINGGFPNPIDHEDRELVRSQDVYSYVERPQMMTAEVTRRVLLYLKEKKYTFVCINFPNADMVGHTGNVTAAKKAISFLDDHVSQLVDYALSQNGTAVVTADHGNAEHMIDAKTGEMRTQHTTNSVPCIIIDAGLAKKRVSLKKNGKLSDIAPTLLKLMNIKKPKEMTGTSLI